MPNINLILRHFASERGRQRQYRHWIDHERGSSTTSFKSLDAFLKANPETPKPSSTGQPLPTKREPQKPLIGLSEGDALLVRMGTRSERNLVIYGNEGTGRRSAVDSIADYLEWEVHEITYPCIMATAKNKLTHLAESKAHTKNGHLLVSGVRCDVSESDDIANMLNTHLKKKGNIVTTCSRSLAHRLSALGWYTMAVPNVHANPNNGTLLQYMVSRLKTYYLDHNELSNAVYNALASRSHVFSFGEAYRLVNHIVQYATRHRGIVDVEMKIGAVLDGHIGTASTSYNWRQDAEKEIAEYAASQ